ncbi:hypothetical protein L227DRAFT_255994 [Lentinus tigrinus ALCF2SS1-6]|uniref:C2H2-type domain-containing protein n=1 Tax=Lentinus tigrinus ALCF2SS1-6 TaxID=1328759 RepID=A0A5C2S1F3_9APHY|nr:hypothetical protein L227DRAFT_255994 [Lentinus tigrinus ALCF2SS1-6]
MKRCPWTGEWHAPFNAREPLPLTAPRSYYYYSDSESDTESYASSRESRSPSPFSSAGSYHTAMSTPPPEYDSSRESSVAPPTTSHATASGHRKSYRRIVAAESKVAVAQRMVARKRARLEKTANAPAPAGSIVCQWGGCGEHVADGKQLWNHIESVHKPLGGADDLKAASRSAKSEEVEEDMEVEEAEHHAHPDGSTHDDGEDELDDDSSDDDWAESSSRWGTAKKSQSSCMDRYQIRIRCQWKRCTTTIQFAGLRRHVESKHSGLRNTSCPKGCGYVTNRPDMMPRHSVKCHYRGPKKAVVVDE